MKSWNAYKEEYAEQSKQNALDVAAIEKIAQMISEFVNRREEKGITQSELACLAGIKQSALSGMESMKVLPRVDTMIKVLKPLGLTLKIANDS